MDKETFHKAYSLFREVKYFKRELEVAPDMPYYLRHILNARYLWISGILDAYCEINPDDKAALKRVWYQSAPAYPTRTDRQREIGRRLYSWRIDHKIQRMEK